MLTATAGLGGTDALTGAVERERCVGGENRELGAVGRHKTQPGNPNFATPDKDISRLLRDRRLTSNFEWPCSAWTPEGVGAIIVTDLTHSLGAAGCVSGFRDPEPGMEIEGGCRRRPRTANRSPPNVLPGLVHRLGTNTIRNALAMEFPKR
jgi:hypothetical protein